MSLAQSSANPPAGDIKPAPQPGILPISAEMIARQEESTDGTDDMAGVQDTGGRDAGGAKSEATAPGAAQQEGMANPKESSPMGLLNSIARFNGVKPVYKLLKEDGPSHEKIFTVQLTFGEEEYNGSGTSIKRSQHDAAQRALDLCKLPTPERKKKPSGYKLLKSPNESALTSTVQLNSYALKTGVTVNYTVLSPYPSSQGGFRKQLRPRYQNNGPQQGRGEPRQKDHNANPLNGFQGGQRPPHPNQHQSGPPPGPMNMGPRPRGPRGPGPMGPPFNYMQFQSYDTRPMMRPRFRRPYPQTFCVKLAVGNREFIGQGPNQRAARQNAANQALKSIAKEPIPVKKDQATSMVEADVPETTPVAVSVGGDSSDNKSEISKVYEVANFNGLHLEFKVLDESGPPHQKEYKVECTVGNISVTESGSSKKEAKRKAAVAVMPKLKALPPPVKSVRSHRSGWRPSYKKNQSVNKKNAQEPDFGAIGMNPISRLVQVCQAKKLKDPFFEVLHDQPIPDRRGHQTVYRHIFTLQVTVGDNKAEGKGSTKKDAKKDSAETMLLSMNYTPSQPEATPPPVPGADATPSKPSLKQPQENQNGKKDEESQNSDRKVTFQDDQVNSNDITTSPISPVANEDKEGGEEEPLDGATIPGSQQGSQIPGITPGLFPMMPGIKPIQSPRFQQPGQVQQQSNQGLNRAPGAPVTGITTPRKNYNAALTADIASELLLTKNSLTAQSALQANNLNLLISSTRPKHLLEYLGSATGLEVIFNDIPQSNQNEFLSEVRISTEPPVAIHGSGQTVDASHDLASLNVLRALAGIMPEDCNRVGQGIGMNTQ